MTRRASCLCLSPPPNCPLTDWRSTALVVGWSPSLQAFDSVATLECKMCAARWTPTGEVPEDVAELVRLHG